MPVVKAERVEGMDQLEKPGQYVLTRLKDQDGFHGLIAICPCGSCGLMPALHFSTHPGAGPKWTWDGNEAATTLTPSVQRNHPNGCRWHGYLTAGEWRPV